MCKSLTKIRREEFDDKKIGGEDYDKEDFNSEER